MPALCSLSVDERDGIVLATLAGEIDLSNADGLGAELRGQISNRDLAVIVDLSDVIHIDSQGIAMLFDLRRRLQRRQQALHVVLGKDGHLRRLLELVDFGGQTGLHRTIADAHAGIAAGDGDGDLAA